MEFEKGKKYVSISNYFMNNNFLTFEINKSYYCNRNGYLSSLLDKEHNMIGKESYFYELLTSTNNQHYDNTDGSLYEFFEDKQLNVYEFEIIKRVMSCRKKGLFLQDLEKTKILIDLYIKHYEI